MTDKGFEMMDIDREMLLGYLMNALEAEELSCVERELLRQPKLRSELAQIQKELSPLASLYGTVPPPHGLARRTCKHIWTVVDGEEKVGRNIHAAPAHPDQIVSISISSLNRSTSPTSRIVARIPDGAFDGDSLDHTQIIKKLVALSPSFEGLIPQKTTFHEESPKKSSHRLVRRLPQNPRRRTLAVHRDREDVGADEKTVKSRWHVGILASVAVGILIAVIAFPAINFAKNHAKSIVTQNKIKEFNRGIVHYTPLETEAEKNNLSDQVHPVNLARSGWQEINNTPLSVLTLADDTEGNIALAVPPIIPSKLLQSCLPVSTTATFFAPSCTERDIILGQVPTSLDKTDTRSLAYQTLLTDVSYTIPAGNGSMLQTAYGQHILFQNGRIFLRILPVFNQRPPTETMQSK